MEEIPFACAVDLRYVDLQGFKRQKTVIPAHSQVARLSLRVIHVDSSKIAQVRKSFLASLVTFRCMMFERYRAIPSTTYDPLSHSPLSLDTSELKLFGSTEIRR